MMQDGMSAEDAEELVQLAREDLQDRLIEGESPEDICEEWFGLEPDYINKLL
jgi:hypothetical protein